MMAARKIFGYRGAGKLPTTRWTMVINAGQDATAERDKALAELCAMYWTPVYGFIRAMGRRPEDARDLTQGFFTTRLLEKNDVAAADRTKGRFRNWLLTAVKSYLANDLARARAKKRGDEKLFAKMIPLLTHTGAESHRVIAEELGMREKTFNVALSRCRSRFQEQIREEVAETVIHKDEVDDELRFLCSGL